MKSHKPRSTSVTTQKSGISIAERIWNLRQKILSVLLALFGSLYGLVANVQSLGQLEQEGARNLKLLLLALSAAVFVYLVETFRNLRVGSIGLMAIGVLIMLVTGGAVAAFSWFELGSGGWQLLVAGGCVLLGGAVGSLDVVVRFVREVVARRKA